MTQILAQSNSRQGPKPAGPGPRRPSDEEARFTRARPIVPQVSMSRFLRELEGQPAERLGRPSLADLFVGLDLPIMPDPIASTAAYIDALPEDRRGTFSRLCGIFRDHLPAGFDETFAYGMPGFCVPHSRYPAGYHCDPKIALPFVQIASQKKHLAVYHMGLYALPDELERFQASWSAATTAKLDIGKSCIRLDPAKPVPAGVFEELARRITVERWIEIYESKLRPKKT